MLHLSKKVSKVKSLGMYRCGGLYLADTIEDARVEAWKNRKVTGKCCINRIIEYDFTEGITHTLPVEMVQFHKGGAYTEKENERGVLRKFDIHTGELTGDVVYKAGETCTT